jgi:hypothetical protein
MAKKSAQDRWNWSCNELYAAIERARKPLAEALWSLKQLEEEVDDRQGYFLDATQRQLDPEVPDIAEFLREVENKVDDLAGMMIKGLGREVIA